MKYIKFLLVGIFFGTVLTKSEAISWFRMQEMFRFQSIHMYGIIGTAVIVGAIILFVIKKTKAKNYFGDIINIDDKPNTYKASLFGGILFGFGWALIGACPGPMYTLLGQGAVVVSLAILSALFGTYCYGMLKSKLPH